MKKSGLKNTLFIFMVFVLFAAPFFLAHWFYEHKSSEILSTLGTVNNGRLIQPPIKLSYILSDSQQATPEKWIFLCVVRSTEDKAVITRLLDKLERIRLALGKEYSKTSLILGLPKTNGLPENWPVEMQSIPRIILSEKGIHLLLDRLEGSSNGIFLVDPHGNVIMLYPPDEKSDDIYKDIQRLLKYSEE